MPRAKQFTFAPFADLKDSRHGGGIRLGRRKTMRPISIRQAMHITMRATPAQGEWSMLRVKFEKKIKLLALKLARENHVQIHQYANSGNHLHLLVHAKTREGFQRFLRVFTGLVARLVMGAKKGVRVLKAGQRFWDGLAFSRIVSGGREFVEVKYYIIRNELEALGILFYSDRKQRPKPPTPRRSDTK